MVFIFVEINDALQNKWPCESKKSLDAQLYLFVFIRERCYFFH